MKGAEIYKINTDQITYPGLCLLSTFRGRHDRRGLFDSLCSVFAILRGYQNSHKHL